MTPQRVQRKRTKGWRMPEGAVYVGRPTLFGNPWSNFRNRSLSVALYEDMARGIWSPNLLLGYSDEEVAQIYNERRQWLRRLGGAHPSLIIWARLEGRDLACWCPLVDEVGQPVECHADVLLRISNGLESPDASTP